MINAKDLRIGNIIDVGHEDRIVDSEDIAWLEENKSFTKQWKGIPLTEKWLLKFGFEKITIKHQEFRNAFVWNGGDEKVFDYVFFLGKPEYKIDNPNIGILNIHHPLMKDVPAPTNEDINNKMDWPESTTPFAWHIIYLHQLQNLIFSITGQELTIKNA